MHSSRGYRCGHALREIGLRLLVIVLWSVQMGMCDSHELGPIGRTTLSADKKEIAKVLEIWCCSRAYS